MSTKRRGLLDKRREPATGPSDPKVRATAKSRLAELAMKVAVQMQNDAVTAAQKREAHEALKTARALSQLIDDES